MPTPDDDKQPIRIVLVDDHAVMRAGLRLIIEGHTGMKVVGEAANSADAVAVTARERPDIILLDLDLGKDSGLDCLPQLLAAADPTRVLVLTGMDDYEAHRRAARLGAMGLVHKAKAAEIILKAIEKVHAGEVWFDRSLLGGMLNDLSRAGQQKKGDPEADKIATLTRREHEVVTLICEGLKNRQISERLFISETTVSHHLTSIFGKLGVTDRLELVVYAYTQGIVKSPAL
jgi:two-component system nitrate/nitrite response regulator NarL